MESAQLVFFGNFLLALLLVGLGRFLWLVCGLLVRSGDVGNRIFAGVLPLLMLYLLVGSMPPIDSRAGFAAGLLAGGAAMFGLQRFRKAA